MFCVDCVEMYFFDVVVVCYVVGDVLVVLLCDCM